VVDRPDLQLHRSPLVNHKSRPALEPLISELDKQRKTCRDLASNPRIGFQHPLWVTSHPLPRIRTWHSETGHYSAGGPKPQGKNVGVLLRQSHVMTTVNDDNRYSRTV
jgi:hypothetical protein